ncbi:triose-phosphate isomerase [Candidatus Woesearchaeota archaeon]|nr:triose-phosphate isomerase [Candidatus Woesearchaeota archaeon]MBW3005513.1 triose-phosphate isomerase [Candidatus Woesearchaeota archaeon]
MIIINFKKYKTGKEAVKLAKTCEKYKAICAVLPEDVPIVSREVKTPVYYQYIKDKVPYKKAKGTLLNHSDHPISNKTIKRRLKIAKKAGLKTVVCCTNTKRAKEIDKMKPDYIAVEPKELIGGKISVSKARPELIEHTVKAVKTKVLCGAGINTRQDIKTALKLGAKGVLVASAVAKAKQPAKKLAELTKDLNKR